MKALHVVGRLAPILLLAGCTAPPGAPGVPPAATGYQVLQAGRQAPAAARPQAAPSAVLQAFPFLAAARLTPAQEARIMGMLQRVPQPSEATEKAQLAAWKGLLGARKVDTKAMRAFLVAREAEDKATRDRTVALFRDMRGVLNPRQRGEVAKWIREAIAKARQRPATGAPGQAGGGPGGPAPGGAAPGQAEPPDLGLTPAQEAKLDAAAPDVAPGGPEAAATALATFFERGDAASLAAAFPVVKTKIAALVEAYAGLTQAQRAKLLAEPAGRPPGR